MISLTGRCYILGYRVINRRVWKNDLFFSDEDYLATERVIRELLEKRPLWNTKNDPLSPYVHLPVTPLSAIDSRHMITEILPKVRHVPFKLSDLLGYSAQGNPLYLEQMVHFLYDEGIIQKQEMEDTVNLGKLEQLNAPPSLSEMFAARIAILPIDEKKVIEAAAVCGYLFWDEAIVGMLFPDVELSPEVLQMTLTALEQKGFILRHRASILVGTSEFVFAHDKLVDVIYAQLLPSVRQAYHGRLADWLVGRMKPQYLSHYSPLIVMHYQKAGRTDAVMQWSAQRNGWRGEVKASE